MKPIVGTADRCTAVLAGSLMLTALTSPANAAGCSFEPQGEGRAAAVIDIRTFRLEDGREVRLAGIEPFLTDKAKGAAAPAAIIGGREATVRGRDGAPDRYGRQPAFAFPKDSETPVQAELL